MFTHIFLLAVCHKSSLKGLYKQDSDNPNGFGREQQIDLKSLTVWVGYKESSD